MSAECLWANKILADAVETAQKLVGLNLPPREGRDLREQVNFLYAHHSQDDLIELWHECMRTLDHLADGPTKDLLLDEMDALWYAVDSDRRP